MSKSMLLSSLFILLIGLFSLPASAQPYPYHWEINVAGNGWQGVNYPSAEATCFREGITSGESKYVYLSFVYVREDFGYCNYDRYYQGKYVGQTDIGRIGHRFGDYCASGTTYNPKNGACEAIPADVGKPCADSSLDNPSFRQTDNTCKPLSQSPINSGVAISQSCPVKGDPINFSVGNSFQLERDYQSGGQAPLELTRFYNSIDGTWRHNYSSYLRVGENFSVLVLNDGREIYFNVSGSIATTDSIRVGTLIKEGSSWVYTAPDSTRSTFDSQGKLIRLDLPSGTYETISYSSSTLTVRSSAGPILTVTEDGLHQPVSLSANGVSITYNYTITSQQRLSSLTRTFSQSGITETRTFVYEGNSNRLTGIIDERGIRYVTWVFDNQGRALSSEFQGGVGKVSFAYNADGTVTQTNELGKQTVFHFVLINGVKHISQIEGEPTANCPESNASYTYDERGQMTSKTDAKGAITTYAYNDRGLEVSRTQASGTSQARTTTTTWHAAFNLPVTVTEAGQKTTYTYDAQGRKTARTQTAL